MPSTTSLYTSMITQEVSGGDTTSLYGGGGNAPIPGGGGGVVRGNLTITGNLIVQQDATILGELNVNDINILNDLCVEGDTITLRCDSTTPGNAYIVVDRDGNTPDATITWNESTDQWESNFAIVAPTVQGGNITIAPAGSTNRITWPENNTLTDRLQFQSTNGNTTGLQVLAPTTATPGSIIDRISIYNSSDPANGAYFSTQARDGATDKYRIVTGTYTGGVSAANGLSINFYDNTTKYASINPAGPTNNKDLVTLEYLTAGNFVFSQVNIDNRVFLDSGILSTTSTTPNQVLNTFLGTTYASAKYQIQVKSGSDIHVMEVLVMHNGTTAYQTVYAEMFSNVSLTNIAVTLVGSDVLLQVTPTNAVTTYKFSRTLVTA